MIRKIDVVMPDSEEFFEMRGFRPGRGSVYQPIRTQFLIWDDISENVRAVEKAYTERSTFDPEAMEEQMLSYATRDRDRWIGRPEGDIRDMASLVKAVESPWERGLELFDKMLGAIEKVDLPVPRSIRRSPQWSEENGDFELDRFREGLAPWRGTLRRDTVGRQFVTIVVQLGALADMRAENLIWRGLAALVLAKMAEDQGYSAEILAYSHSAGPVTISGRSDNVCNATWVKRADQVLDTSALVNAMSAWFFRTVTFLTYHIIPRAKVSYGYGRTQTMSDRLVRLALGVPDAEYWKIDQCFNQEDAITTCVTYLKELAGNLDEQETRHLQL